MKPQSVKFIATIHKYSSNGEKTGWSYIEIPADIAIALKPKNKKSFRVKGTINGFSITFIALLPVGDGNFILSVNAAIRKEIGKSAGAQVKLELSEDTSTYTIDQDFLECLEEEKNAKFNFYKLAPSHQNYYSKWIESAKTEVTKSKRIALALNALSKGKHFGEMMREKKLNGN